MTKPREWPNRAKEARDRAAEELQRAVRELSPVITRELRFEKTEVVRRQAVALLSVQKALRHLESVGAQTRPD